MASPGSILNILCFWFDLRNPQGPHSRSIGPILAGQSKKKKTVGGFCILSRIQEVPASVGRSNTHRYKSGAWYE